MVVDFLCGFKRSGALASKFSGLDATRRISFLLCKIILKKKKIIRVLLERFLKSILRTGFARFLLNNFARKFCKKVSKESFAGEFFREVLQGSFPKEFCREVLQGSFAGEFCRRVLQGSFAGEFCRRFLWKSFAVRAILPIHFAWTLPHASLHASVPLYWISNTATTQLLCK